MILLYIFLQINSVFSDDSEAHNALQGASPEAYKIQQLYFKLQFLKSAGKLKESHSVIRNLTESRCAETKLNTAKCPNVMDQRYPLYDGSCNNRIVPGRGQAYQPLKRLLPAKYDDNIETLRKSVTGADLPSARKISTAVETVERPKLPPVSEVTHMFTQWGQFIIHDIVHTPIIKGEGFTDLECPCDDPHPECVNIEIPEDDKQFSENRTCFWLARSVPTPKADCSVNGNREQLNQISSYIDGTTVYGISENLVQEIRDPDSDAGELLVNRKYSGKGHGDHLPSLENMKKEENGGTFACPLRLAKERSGCQFAGDKRINENAGLASMHTVFMREHNRIARKLKSKNPHWSSDAVFDETRLIIAAIHQVITYNEYLPSLVGPLYMKRYGINLAKSGYFYGYDASIDASVTNEFTTAAFRFGHSMINDQLSRPTADWEAEDAPLKMKESLFNPASFLNSTHSSVNPILRGLCNDMSLKADTNFPESMKDFLFANPDSFGKDLFAINIQRGRDHGLASYNDYREFFGMQRARDFSQLHEIPEMMRKKLSEIYADVDDIDVYAGGLAEIPVDGGLVGPVFAHMMASQFRDLKYGDRFWFENGGCETVFTPEQLNELRKVTLASLMCTCTDTNSIQRFPFKPVFDSSKSSGPNRNGYEHNPRVGCDEIYILDLEAWREPYINSDDRHGYADTGSWTSWLTPLGSPKSLDLDILHRERPLETCLNTIKSELRFINADRERPQIRFMCPAGGIYATDFPSACLDRGKWTSWFDQNDPLPGHNYDDVETIRNLDKHARPNEICEEPIFIQAQRKDGTPAQETGDVFEVFDPRKGLICRGRDQESGRCGDYRVRFFCPNENVKDKMFDQMAELEENGLDLNRFQWTIWFTADEPNWEESPGDFEFLNKARYHLPEICKNPFGIEAVTVDGEKNALCTGDVFRTYHPSKGLVCANSDQTNRKCADYKVRYLCEKLAPDSEEPEPPAETYMSSFETQTHAAVAARTEFSRSQSEKSQNQKEQSETQNPLMSSIITINNLCRKEGLCCIDADFHN